MPDKKKYDIEGYGIKDNRYYTYWTDVSNQEILVNNLDFLNKKTENKRYSNKSIQGRVISRLTINNFYYVITLIKNTNLINIYKFDGFELSTKSVDLTGTRFIDQYGKNCNLWQMFDNGTSFEPAFSIQNISQETPPSLVFIANKRKLYVNNNSLVFTLDQNNKFTQTFSINLEDNKVVQKVYNKPFIPDNEFVNFESNSFIFEDKILLLKTTKERLIIDIRHLNNDLIKTLEANIDEEISFQNSEIIQESKSVKNRRVLGKSNQFLRKITNLNGALSCYSVDDTVYMTLGGVSLIIDNSAAITGGLMFGMAGALIGAALSSNYSQNNLSSYSQRNVVYMNSIFDRSFNHINGTIKKLPFDELRYYVASFDTDLSTIFKLNNNLYFCKHDNNNLTFYEFKN